MRLLTIGAMQQQAHNLTDPDVQTYLGSLAVPLLPATITVINNNIVGLKAALGITNLSNAFDQILILGNETQEAGLNNAVKRLHDATPIDNPNFTQYIGFNGDGLTKYINSNYTPSVDTDNFTLNNASFGFFKNEDQSGALYDMGARAGANLRHTWMAAKLSVNNQEIVRAHISDNAPAGGNLILPDQLSNPNSIALYTASRLLSTGLSVYRNDVKLIDAAYASSALTNFPLFVCGMNNAGALLTAAPSTKQLSLSYIGRGFTAAEMVHVSYWFNKLIAEMQAL